MVQTKEFRNERNSLSGVKRKKGRTALSPDGRRLSPRLLTLLLVLLLTGAVGAALFQGAYALGVGDTLRALVAGLGWGREAVDPSLTYLLWHIRLPRILAAALVGGGLAVTGAALQGLFRNPLADPALIGVTSGGVLFAVGSIVLSGTLLASWSAFWGYASVAAAAFLGSLLTTWLVYRLATREGGTYVTTMLLAGIAVTAFGGAITGLLTYFSTEEQLRDITFWTMGSVSGADWPTVFLLLAAIVPALAGLLRVAPAIDLLLLGEDEAACLGLGVERLKRRIILLAALVVGVCVSVTGIIAFVALVVPHWVRLLAGPLHRSLLINAALLGAALLVVADGIARMIIAPAELPIGILTALLGAPFFIWLLMRQRLV